MAMFITRVELHSANWSDYDRLHQQMKNQGYTQTIQSVDGHVYELPPAEYHLSANTTRTDAIERAKRAVAAINKKGAVFVTEAVGCTWNGLAYA